MRIAKWVLGAFLAGVLSSAPLAWATKTVEVTFFGSGLPSPKIFCSLHDSIPWVECLKNPCE